MVQRPLDSDSDVTDDELFNNHNDDVKCAVAGGSLVICFQICSILLFELMSERREISYSFSVVYIVWFTVYCTIMYC